ncbi:MAG: hypothetical protein OCC49_08895 [Fibrobacterales bacterium]
MRILLSLFLLSITSVFSYDLNEFRSTNYSKSSLYITPMISGDYTGIHGKQENIFAPLPDEGTALLGSATLIYARREFSDRNEWSGVVGLHGNYVNRSITDWSDSLNSEIVSTTAMVAPYGSFSYTHYFGLDDWYLGADGGTHYSIDYNEIEEHGVDTSAYESNIEGRHHYWKGGVSAGFGRFQSVTYARTAYYIVEALFKKGIIDDVRSDYIESIAHLLQETEKIRVWDEREHRTLQLEAIDAFFKEYGLVVEAALDYFTIINDFLMDTHPERQSGLRVGLAFRVEGTRHTYEVNASGKSENEFKYSRTFGVIEHHFTEALSLNWHIENKIYLESGAFSGDRVSVQHEIAPNATGWLSAIGHQTALSYYPSSRTEVSLTVGGNYWFIPVYLQTKHYDTTVKYENYMLTVGASMQYVWYFSTKLKLLAECGVYHSMERVEAKYWGIKAQYGPSQRSIVSEAYGNGFGDSNNEYWSYHESNPNGLSIDYSVSIQYDIF